MGNDAMQANVTASAVIAEDEPLLAAALRSELERAWPGLAIVATAGDGICAVTLALEHRPDVLFFDIRMPGKSGLDAAAELADAWDLASPGSRPFPLLVFVTAYEQYAVDAFETQAVDYLVKPVQAARLAKTVDKIQRTLASRPAASEATNGTATGAQTLLEHTLAQLRALLAGPVAAPAPRLSMLQVSVGATIRMVPLQEVLYFEAADKYVRVLTGDHEYLVRTPLRELLPQLDPDEFWQVHRATVVRARMIEQVTRDDAGKVWLRLRGCADRLAVSRLYAHQFRAL